MHAGDGEQRGGVVLGGDQRPRRQAQVVAGDKKLNEGAANVVRGHGGSVGSRLSAEPGQIRPLAFKSLAASVRIKESMPRLRRSLTCLSILLGCRARSPLPPRPTPAAIQFSADNYTVHESSGFATITVVRGDTSQEAHADYIAVGLGHPCGGQACTATPPDNGVGVNHTPADFRATKGQLDFARRVKPARASTFRSSTTTSQTIDKTVSVGIFAAWPQGTPRRDHAVLTILGDDADAAARPRQPADAAGGAGQRRPARAARASSSIPTPRSPGPPASTRASTSSPSQPGASRYGTFTGKDPGDRGQPLSSSAPTHQGPGTVRCSRPTSWSTTTAATGRRPRPTSPTTTTSSPAWPRASAATRRSCSSRATR